MRTSSVRVAAAAVALGLAVAGCSSSEGTGAGGAGTGGAAAGGRSSGGAAARSGRIIVFAAASLTEAFTTLGRKFEAAHADTKVDFKFDASSALAADITQGQAADVFASAATSNMASVVSGGDANPPTNFVSNTMEIATPPGNPAHVSSVPDLAKSSVKVALCDPAVPCGATAQAVFEKAKVHVKPVSRAPDVKSTLALVESKEVDAGMVYVTDVRAAGAKVTGVPIADGVNASTTYPIAVLTHSTNAALAQAWVDYVLSSAGQKVLRADGFSPP
jgi:molybdate transport system substrate-binding protein